MAPQVTEKSFVQTMREFFDASAFIGPLAPTKSALVARIREQQSGWNVDADDDLADFDEGNEGGEGD